MSLGVLLFIALTVGATMVAPLAARAESEACRATCEAYRDCAGDALDAILNGTVGNASCGSYQSCEQVVQLCRAQAGACERECEDS